MALPRRPGSTSAATAVAPQTVTTPNPSPRSAASAVTVHSRSLARCPSAGKPSRPDPSTSVQRQPRPASRRRIDSWASTVQAIMTPVTSPAPRPSPPPRITHNGATGSSSAKPENHSAAEPSSQGIPVARQTEPEPGAGERPSGRGRLTSLDSGFTVLTVADADAGALARHASAAVTLAD